MIRTIAGGSFESEWQAVAPALERILARRGVTGWLRDDVMQETALRLYRSWDRVDPDRPLLPLAVTIANNVVWDERHKRSQVEVPGVVPDRPAVHDVEELGLARMELGKVRDLMSRLSAPHRSVLLAEVGGAAVPEGSKDATKMLRLRARKKMRSLMEAASASGFVMFVPKSLWRVVRNSRRSAMTASAPAAIAAACSIVALFGVPDSAIGPRDPFGGGSVAKPAVASGDAVAANSGPTGARAPVVTESKVATASKGPQLRPEPAPTSYWQIGVGDEEGPVEGDAGFGLVNDPNEEISPPECSVERPSEEEVKATCRVDLGEQQFHATAEAELRP
ncbi:MAG TPA: sigma-70 family RNA polymerase sigma factor [Actinomycetota bacterium]|nr:sigma-70 family RNA polymerase sigma factor [Actinomycetota bacterium]